MPRNHKTAQKKTTDLRPKTTEKIQGSSNFLYLSDRINRIKNDFK